MDGSTLYACIVDLPDGRRFAGKGKGNACWYAPTNPTTAYSSVYGEKMKTANFSWLVCSIKLSNEPPVSPPPMDYIPTAPQLSEYLPVVVTTDWLCFSRRDGSSQGEIFLDTGHNTATARSICDIRKPFCQSNGGCFAERKYHWPDPQPASSDWRCYLMSDASPRGSVHIWWGHNEGASRWACNNWVSDCMNYGGCFSESVTMVPLA